MVVTTIILIVSFVILLYFITSTFSDNISNREACHQSVVLRATLPGALNLNQYSPLNCETEKICIRGSKFLGKGKCEDSYGNKEKVTYKNVDNLNEVEKVIADEIVNCYSMMGEGKLSLFSHGLLNEFGLGKVYSSCVICSRIAFDNKTLNDKGINVSKRDVYHYMLTHKIPNGNKSYYEYLLGGRAGVSINSPKESLEFTDPDTKENKIINSSDFSSISSNTGNEDIAVLFMQITSPSHKEVLLNTAGVIVGGNLLVSPVSGSIKIFKCATNLYCLGSVLVALGIQQINVENNLEIAATHCEDISVGEDSSYGCTVIRTINYDLENIKNFCGQIESKVGEV